MKFLLEGLGIEACANYSSVLLVIVGLLGSVAFE